MEVGGCLSITLESPSNEIEGDFYCGNGILSNGSSIGSKFMSTIVELWICPFRSCSFDSEEGETVLEVVCDICGLSTSKGKSAV